MSLSSSIHLAGNSLRSAEIGLQVVGQNIANAATPGYLREEVLLQPAPTQKVGHLPLGLGVQVAGIIQKVDHFLEERLRGATSDRASAEAQEQAYLQLEGIIGELGEQDLSTSLSAFFASITDVLNQPEDLAVRNLAVLKGQTLAADVVRMQARVTQTRVDLDKKVSDLAGDVNRLIGEIRALNVRVAETEGGDASLSDAVGLRDQRNLALSNLASLIDIRVQEQPSGAVAVYAGGTYLVYEGTARQVRVEQDTDRGLTVSRIVVDETDALIESGSGELAGLIAARDQVVGGFLDDLNTFGGTLAFEFNKLYASGQGLKGFQSLTSLSAVDNVTAALDAAGLKFQPVNGSFQVQVLNRRTGLTKTTDITVDLNGLDQDTSLEDLAARLDAIDGLSASITADRKLSIASESVDQEFAFAQDSSGALAALGLNVFFTGFDAGSLGVSEVLRADPAKFAASRGGIGQDTANAVELARFQDLPIESQNGATFNVLYDRLVGETTQASSQSRAVAESLRSFEQTLQSQQMAVSGVSIDEETIKLLTFQRMYQASAKYISVLAELIDTLVNL
jgi:flagellar hook-associated protein 1 FlgK